MAAAAHFSTRIYGEVEGNPPFEDGTGKSAFSRIKPWPAATIASLPTDGTVFYTLPNGAFIGGAYVYSVIVMPATGLNKYGTKYVSDSSVATLATLAG